ncbi:hypothetical protein [Xanthomonas sp. A1809]|uniref:hypothetical protein n=1 Tax=Xanthomonas sp. A1809 TaxID=2821275 RepID=UPI001ADD0C16|nr:hypothetical protein [Xanthomonas sp. A1809]MBO9858823.1 hypothetical protein [Xanthomonas sp. A1809]
MARTKIQLKEEFTEIPLVVVNMATRLGVPVNDVPVIDDLILKRFLIGKLEASRSAG